MYRNSHIDLKEPPSYAYWNKSRDIPSSCYGSIFLSGNYLASFGTFFWAFFEELPDSCGSIFFSYGSSFFVTGEVLLRKCYGRKFLWWHGFLCFCFLVHLPKASTVSIYARGGSLLFVCTSWQVLPTVAICSIDPWRRRGISSRGLP